MRALDLDFRRQNRSAQWLGMALLLAGLASALAAGAQYRHLAGELPAAEASLHQSGTVARGQSAATHSSGVRPQDSQEMKRATEVAFALKLPWNDLFASVEAANTPNVALLSIESDTGKRQVKIAGEAKDMDSMLDYLRFIAAQPKLANAYLQSHQLQQQDPQRPVRFVLGADWVAGH